MKSKFLIFNIIFCVVFIMNNCGRKNKGYVIKGDVEGFADSTMLYLVNPDIDKTIDSALVLDGEFQFSGEVESPVRFFLHTKYERGKSHYYTSFWVENSVIYLKGTAENFTFAKVTGSEPQKVANILQKEVKPYHSKRDSLTQIAIKMRREGADQAAFSKI